VFFIIGFASVLQTELIMFDHINTYLAYNF